MVDRPLLTVDRKGSMKISGLAILTCLFLPLFFLGCSDEEVSPPDMGKRKVVKSIVKPAERTPEPPSSVEEEKAQPQGKTDPETGGRVAALNAAAPERDEEGSAGSGYYVVKAGDSLSSIAARDDVYGDSLKWIILFRHNRAALGQFPQDREFPNRDLPIGTRLKILSSDERKANLNERSGKAWIVNIHSSTDAEEIVPAAIALAKEGYPVYLTRFEAKGKDWVRLRLGYFKDRAEADGMGKEIQKRLNLAETWSSKAGKNEIAEFRGF